MSTLEKSRQAKKQKAFDEGDPASDEGKPASDEGNPASDEGNPASDEGNPTSDEDKPASDEGKIQIINGMLYMAVLGGVYPAPVTVAIFTSFEHADEFCRTTNASIPTDSVCHLSVRQMSVGTPSKQELQSRVSPPIDKVTQERIDRLRDAEPDTLFGMRISPTAY